MKNIFLNYINPISFLVFLLIFNLPFVCRGSQGDDKSNQSGVFKKPYSTVFLKKCVPLAILFFVGQMGTSPQAFSLAHHQNRCFISIENSRIAALPETVEEDENPIESFNNIEADDIECFQSLTGKRIASQYQPRTFKPISMNEFSLNPEILNKGDIQIFSKPFRKDNMSELNLDSHVQFGPELSKHNWDKGVLVRRVFVLPNIDSHTITPDLTSSKEWIEKNNKGMSVLERISDHDDRYLKSIKKLTFFKDILTTLHISQETGGLENFSNLFNRGITPTKIHVIKMLDSNEPILKLTYSLIQFIDLPDQSGVLVINDSMILLELENKDIKSFKKLILKNLPEEFRIKDLDHESIYFVTKAREYANNRKNMVTR